MDLYVSILICVIIFVYVLLVVVVLCLRSYFVVSACSSASHLIIPVHYLLLHL